MTAKNGITKWTLERDSRGHYSRIARDAWKNAPEGESIFKGHTVVKNDKTLFIMPSSLEHLLPRPGFSSRYYRVVAFPKPERRQIFLDAKKHLAGAGPAEKNKGAVGTVSCIIYPGERFVVLAYAQAHYRTVKGVFPRKLASHYAGWRKEALKQAMLLAHTMGKDFFIPAVYLRELRKFRNGPTKLGLEEDVKALIRELGVPYSRSLKGLVIMSPRK